MALLHLDSNLKLYFNIEIAKESIILNNISKHSVILYLNLSNEQFRK